MILTRKEVAKILTVSLRTLERLESAKKMPAKVQISPRRVGYRETDISKFIEERLKPSV